MKQKQIFMARMHTKKMKKEDKYEEKDKIMTTNKYWDEQSEIHVDVT